MKMHNYGIMLTNTGRKIPYKTNSLELVKRYAGELVKQSYADTEAVIFDAETGRPIVKAVLVPDSMSASPYAMKLKFV